MSTPALSLLQACLAAAEPEPGADSELLYDIARVFSKRAHSIGNSYLKVYSGVDGKDLFLSDYHASTRRGISGYRSWMLSPTPKPQIDRNNHILTLRQSPNSLHVEVADPRGSLLLNTKVRALPGDNKLMSLVHFLQQHGVLQQVFDSAHEPSEHVEAAAEPEPPSRLWDNIVTEWHAHVSKRAIGAGEQLKIVSRAGKYLFLIPFNVEERRGVFLFSPTPDMDRNKDHYSLRLDAHLGKNLLVEVSGPDGEELLDTNLRSLPGDNGLVAFIAFLRQRGVLQKVFEGVHKANS